MKIINLMENTNGENKDCLIEHGLSFYIETKNHNILMDTGASHAFAVNADVLGVDLMKVDIAILSHGHYDHAGGLLTFAKRNNSASICMRKEAGGAFYHGTRYIGIHPEILKLPQVQFLEGNVRLDEELFLFGNVTGRKLWPQGNLELKVKRGSGGIGSEEESMSRETAEKHMIQADRPGKNESDAGQEFIQDDFSHEQYLVVQENGKRVLFSGCAHNGILNILEHYQKLLGGQPDAVFSGFHMNRKNGYRDGDLETIRAIARELTKSNTKFYTGHCTGEFPFKIMREIMGSQLKYVHSGDSVYI